MRQFGLFHKNKKAVFSVPNLLNMDKSFNPNLSGGREMGINLPLPPVDFVFITQKRKKL